MTTKADVTDKMVYEVQDDLLAAIGYIKGLSILTEEQMMERLVNRHRELSRVFPECPLSIVPKESEQ